MATLNMPIPRTSVPGETEAGAFQNAYRDAISALLNPPHFKGVLAANTVIAAGTNIAWPSVEDNYSGWDSTNHWWVVPPTWGGLYICHVQIKWGTTLPAANLVLGVFGGAAGTTAVAHSPSPEALANNAGLDLTHFIRVSAGDRIGVQSLNSGFTASADTVDSTYFNFGFYSA